MCTHSKSENSFPLPRHTVHPYKLASSKALLHRMPSLDLFQFFFLQPISRPATSLLRLGLPKGLQQLSLGPCGLGRTRPAKPEATQQPAARLTPGLAALAHQPTSASLGWASRALKPCRPTHGTSRTASPAVPIVGKSICRRRRYACQRLGHLLLTRTSSCLLHRAALLQRLLCPLRACQAATCRRQPPHGRFLRLLHEQSISPHHRFIQSPNAADLRPIRQILMLLPLD